MWVSVSPVNNRNFSYPGELPVVERRHEIADLIKKHQVVIVAGETGSGKTTQLPKICLELLLANAFGRGEKSLIGHTQPRRLAARTVATRIAQELGEPLGVTVGCQVRFQDTSSESTKIKLMTDGILLAEIQRDRLLKKYDVLIIDEAHERSLNIDFLLGYIKLLLSKRPELKLIITSATIDVQRFSQHFSDSRGTPAPVITVEGRTYPVDIAYMPPDEMVGKPEDIGEIIEQGLGHLFDSEKSGRVRGGDVLVFLSGERDILETARYLRKQQTFNAQLKHCEIVPLYARLTLKEQQKIFAPHSGRRIVLSTNVAETSLTVPGIRYVIDTGVARISRYSHRTRVQRLPIENIAQASANQRAGRCGRMEAGICLRLYDEKGFLARPAFTDPEIRRTNLASVILQMLLLRLGKMEDFPFLDAPDTRHVNEGYALLEEIGAVDKQRQITHKGRDIARLPVDPRLGAMLVEAQHKRCLREVLIIVSALSVQDPRDRPVDKKQQSDEKHKQWADERSDFVGYLKLWSAFEAQRQALSQNALRKFCEQNFLSWQRMREWRDIHHQLHVACQERNWKENTEAPDYNEMKPAVYANLHQALLAGLLSNIATRQEDREYLGCRQRKLRIFPGSAQAKKAPRWIAAASLIETSQLLAHGVAAIEAQWLLPLAKHLLQRDYFEPFWDESRGMPMIFQRISLYGLVLVERQKVFYGDIDREQAHELLIREALVGGLYRGRADFYARNQQLIAQLQDMEARIRRRDLLVDDSALFAFYASRIPGNIVTVNELDDWYKKERHDNPQLLLLRKEDVLLRDPGDESVVQFPDQLECNGNSLKLVYSFDPGHAQDGVTLQVPLAVLNQIPAEKLTWLVPGFLTDKIQALLRNLPKALRKNLVPLPNTAERIAALLLPVQPQLSQSQSLPEAICQQLLKHYALRLQPVDLDEAQLDPFYRMNIQVLGERDKILAQGRDLSLLRAEFSSQAREVVQQAAVATDFSRRGIRSWDFPDLAETLPQQRGDMRVLAWPALHDVMDSVELTLYDTPEIAGREHRRGLVRLAVLSLPQQVKQLQKDLLRDNKVRLALAGFGSASELMGDLVDTCIAQTFFADGELPRSKADFEQRLTEKKSSLHSVAQKMDQVLSQAVLLAQGIQQHLDLLKATEAKITVQDIRSQLASLWFAGFLRATPYDELVQYARYMEALQKRLEKLRGGVVRDQQAVAQLQRYWQPVLAWMEKKNHGELPVAQQSLRWLLEEWRIALFAQPMKTRVPVSEKRVAELFQQAQSSK
ncbi:MAG TPA: ATP-dependent RNA helicase HrpA [Pseudomonadales bacterium]|nr:ATP-dependent RNA helicase HrpA [Pseudomonadales bacterium]